VKESVGGKKMMVTIIISFLRTCNHRTVPSLAGTPFSISQSVRDFLALKMGGGPRRVTPWAHMDISWKEISSVKLLKVAKM
jgi:hypothetical protein